MEADFVIVGSGSAGSALAYRLGEAGHSVLVLEYGGTDWGPFIQMPAALSYPMNMARYDWGFVTEPEPHLGGRRARRAARQGARRLVLDQRHGLRARPPARLRHLGRDGRRRLGLGRRRCPTSAAWRTGTAGALRLARHRRAAARHPRAPGATRSTTPSSRPGAQAGFELTDDYNGEKQEGFGPMEQTVWHGRRWSAANAYLRPALRAATSRCSGLAERVVIGDGRATGVEVAPRRRARRSTARREVILAASSINTPKLLMLSGIGPAAHLAEHGIAVVADRPGWARTCRTISSSTSRCGAASRSRSTATTTGRRRLRIGAQWLLAKCGLGTSNQFESAAFVRSAAGVDYPDIQFHFLPLAVRYDGKSAVRGHGFQAHVGPMRSPSRGTVRLKSADPAQAPAIRFNYMEHEQDWTRLPPLHPADPRDLRPAGLRALCRRRDPARRARCRPTTSSTPSSASTSRAPTTPAAPRASGGATTRWRWSTRSAG